jgi:ADP-ribose pyrophosphatase YjhB (NUDIX family)
MSKYLFQYCQKLVVFSQDYSQVLLCKRKGENDFDGVYSFIGGKMEITDENILAGIKREKNEEIGSNNVIDVYPTFSANAFFRKKDGNSMILPHYLCVFIEGEISINDEYSDYKWVLIEELNDFEPKIPGIPEVVSTLLKLRSISNETDFVRI